MYSRKPGTCKTYLLFPFSFWDLRFPSSSDAAHCLNIFETFRGIHLVSIVSFINFFDKFSSFLRLRVHLPTKTAVPPSECWVNSCFAEEAAFRVPALVPVHFRARLPQQCTLNLPYKTKHLNKSSNFKAMCNLGQILPHLIIKFPTCLKLDATWQ